MATIFMEILAYPLIIILRDIKNLKIYGSQLHQFPCLFNTFFFSNLNTSVYYPLMIYTCNDLLTTMISCPV